MGGIRYQKKGFRTVLGAMKSLRSIHITGLLLAADRRAFSLPTIRMTVEIR